MNNEKIEGPASVPRPREDDCSIEPCRRAFSREEIIEEAKKYMRETWGSCKESSDKDRWLENLGLLVDFVHDLFPPNAHALAEERSDDSQQRVVGAQP